MDLDLANYDYQLPADLIANQPAYPRDSCRLMVVNRQTSQISHHIFKELPSLLNSDDVLVVNQSRVFPARLRGHKTTGGQVEVLLLRSVNSTDWEVISHPGLKIGAQLIFSENITAQVISNDPEVVLKFNFGKTQLLSLLNNVGTTPIPPYIHATDSENQIRQDYQTIYAKTTGSAAAPTAGLHFTRELLAKFPNIEHVTLHVGLGTFQPLKTQNFTTHHLHREYYHIPPATVSCLNTSKSLGLRIVAVGTTTLRTLESATDQNGRLIPGHSSTQIFIYPPYQFKFVDCLITNFHLPKSSLMLLVAAFAGRELIMEAYRQAVEERYRFFSFGDAMLII